MALSAADVIDRLKLQPHPEGGHYAETWRHQPADGERGSSTAIYYLLAAGERSHWHRVDAAEIWHYYAGDALALSISEIGQATEITVLGSGLATGLIEKYPILMASGYSRKKIIKALNMLSEILNCSKELKDISMLLSLYW